MHAPIEATFAWKRIHIVGPVLIKPAVFDLTDIPCKDGQVDDNFVQNIAKDLLVTKYSTLGTMPPSEKKWRYINNFAIDI